MAHFSKRSASSGKTVPGFGGAWLMSVLLEELGTAPDPSPFAALARSVSLVAVTRSLSIAPLFTSSASRRPDFIATLQTASFASFFVRSQFPIS